MAWLDAKIDTVGERGDIGPTPPRGRDKSGPYALAIASLGLFRAIRQRYQNLNLTQHEM